MTALQFIEQTHIDPQALADEAAAGLRLPCAALPPKFFYDALGSRLFDAITELPEYYPTRTEADIFATHGAAITAAALAVTGAAPVLVDLGAGNCAKAAALFAQLKPRRYVAVDIAAEHLKLSLAALQRAHPWLDIVGLTTDFAHRLVLPSPLVDGPALLFYPGSSIGNFAPPDALRLLREARAAAAGGALLIGVDLIKPTAVLLPAYDDALGVTAAFNRNLLRHVNRLLGADFELADWQHQALFNGAESRIEMHLQAQRALTVRWPGGARRFAAGERIHTENSYKWRRDEFDALLDAAGFGQRQFWSDARAWFGVFLASQ